MFLTPFKKKKLITLAIMGTRSEYIVKQDCNKIEAFVKCTTQHHWKFPGVIWDLTVMYCSHVHVSLQLGEAIIHPAHSTI